MKVFSAALNNQSVRAARRPLEKENVQAQHGDVQ